MQRLDELAHLDRACVVVGDGDEAADLAADVGELPDAEGGDGSAEQDQDAESAIDPRCYLVIAEPHVPLLPETGPGDPRLGAKLVPKDCVKLYFAVIFSDLRKTALLEPTGPWPGSETMFPFRP